MHSRRTGRSSRSPARPVARRSRTASRRTRRSGLGVVSGSATRVALTRAATTPAASRETPKGYFFRTVPNDGQQGDNVATYIHKVLKKKNVRIIDDEEAYSQGLAAQVKNDLQADGVTRDHGPHQPAEP